MVPNLPQYVAPFMAGLTTLSRRSAVSAAAAVIIIGGGLLSGAAAGADSYLSATFATLAIAAVLTAAYTPSWESAEEHGTLLPSFAIELAALLLFDTTRSTALVLLGIVIGCLSAGKRIWPIRHAITRGLAPLAAIQAPGATYTACAPAIGPLAWPARSVPIAAAITSYCLIRVVAIPAILRLTSKQPLDRAWLKRMAGEWPNYVTA